MQNSLFESAELGVARFIDCDLSCSNLSGANMKDTRFLNVTAPSATFQGAICHGSFWEGVKADGCSFQSADLTQAAFLNSDLSRADFNSSLLRFATFSLTNLTNANLNSALLDQTGLARCQMEGLKCLPDQFKDSVLIEPQNSKLIPSHPLKDLKPRVLTGHKFSVYSVAISAEAGIIASGSYDKTVKVWELKSGRLLNTLTGHEDYVSSVAISSEAGIIASGSDDNTVKVWGIEGARRGENLSGRQVPEGLVEERTIHCLPEGEWAVISGGEIILSNAERYAALGINLTNFPARAIAALSGKG